jgi:hypothetical protein
MQRIALTINELSTKWLMLHDLKSHSGHVAGERTLVTTKNNDPINCEKELMKVREELLTEHKG